MKTSSCKNKGRRLQQQVVTKILKTFPKLTDRDVRSQPMGVSGDDVILSEVASNMFPFSIECKCQESLSIWKSLKQAEQNNRKLPAMLVFKRNHSKTYVALELDNLMKLLKENEKLKTLLYNIVNTTRSQ